jgi:ATP-dependent Clp protease adaptor protein ClpS
MEKTREISITENLEEFIDDSEYNVILYNDNVTPFDFVIAVLMSVFDYDVRQAMQITLHVHENNSAIVATTSMEVAYEKVDAVEALNEQFGFLLQTGVEKA